VVLAHQATGISRMSTPAILPMIVKVTGVRVLVLVMIYRPAMAHVKTKDKVANVHGTGIQEVV